MRRLLLILAIALAAYGGFRFWSAYGRHVRDTVPLPARTVRIGAAVVRAEVVATDEERRRGLSGRDSLAADGGMLFTFPEAGRHGFWMQGMRFPLDFIYIRDLSVVAIIERVPVPDTVPLPFAPDEPFDAVLEVNAGWVHARGVRVGDQVAY